MERNKIKRLRNRRGKLFLYKGDKIGGQKWPPIPIFKSLCTAFDKEAHGQKPNSPKRQLLFFV